MARILQKEVYPGTDCQYDHKLVDSMKELDRDTYYKAQIILAKEQISVSLWQAENSSPRHSSVESQNKSHFDK